MSLKYYGIYLAYAPTVDLRNEGLGRYLAAFLKGAAECDDVRFVLVCPSWTRSSLDALFEAEAVPRGCVEVIAPISIPPLLSLYQTWAAYKKRPRSSRLKRLITKTREIKGRYIERTLNGLASADSLVGFTVQLLPIAALLVILMLLAPLWLAIGAGMAGAMFLRRSYRIFGRQIGYARQRLSRLLRGQPKDNDLVLRMYQAMGQREESRMQALIESLPHVRAWYCPTPFWPAFNRIKSPRLMCVPDVVLADFCVGFSRIGGDRILGVFNEIESAIRGGSHFVTYSQSVKWDTLVTRYTVAPDKVSVVHHAPNDLSRWVVVRGLADEEATSVNYCRGQLLNAIHRSTNFSYVKGFENLEIRFIFYASQIRPNKNIITLLRAYEHLLRMRRIKHKLIITGSPAANPLVRQFISDHHLEADVLFLHGLKVQELAACYKLAELAVNPSLSEGGCPFTFSEALSVGTPVVMARIPVSEEILGDFSLQESTFFDPYDWRDTANRIDWALKNKEHLLALQQEAYTKLAKRTWRNVVDEHLKILDQISERP